MLTMTTEFDAPRDLVFRAFVKPDLLVQWLGPHGLSMEIELNEIRDGGQWRFIHRDADGNDFGFHGVFHGTPTVDCVVRTFEFEGYPGHVSIEWMTLEERDGTTALRQSSAFQSVEDRDGMVESGMESGVNDSMERLAELLHRMSTQAG